MKIEEHLASTGALSGVCPGSKNRMLTTYVNGGGSYEVTIWIRQTGKTNPLSNIDNAVERSQARSLLAKLASRVDGEFGDDHILFPCGQHEIVATRAKRIGSMYH